jgi:hypothetical protein
MLQIVWKSLDQYRAPREGPHYLPGGVSCSTNDGSHCHGLIYVPVGGAMVTLKRLTQFQQTLSITVSPPCQTLAARFLI